MSKQDCAWQAMHALIAKKSITFIDLRFTDLQGKEHHVGLPVSSFTQTLCQNGKTVDGSACLGWKGLHESDIILLPDLKTAVQDPFYDEPTLIIRCDIVDPSTHQFYLRAPRTIAAQAESYLKSTGIADTIYFGPEFEFFIFDKAQWQIGMNKAFYQLDSQDAIWNPAPALTSHRLTTRGGAFSLAPLDKGHNLRNRFCNVLAKVGIQVEAHHHEVAHSQQYEITTAFSSLLAKADEVQLFKYVIRNLAEREGKTATFMPKPLFGENGNGMHCHQSLFKEGKNLFASNQEPGLSQTALYYIGGILKHAKALNAFTNSSTNSYKRFVPGFEAPLYLTYAFYNRSAAIRVPYAPPSHRRIEVRFPDPSANPYLAFAALLMAGLDGICNKIHPGKAWEQNMYHLMPDVGASLEKVALTLDEALAALDKDRSFLTAGGVFSNACIDHYLALKQQEVGRLNQAPHPLEFELYYSV